MIGNETILAEGIDPTTVNREMIGQMIDLHGMMGSARSVQMSAKCALSQIAVNTTTVRVNEAIHQEIAISRINVGTIIRPIGRTHLDAIEMKSGRIFGPTRTAPIETMIKKLNATGIHRLNALSTANVLVASIESDKPKKPIMRNMNGAKQLKKIAKKRLNRLPTKKNQILV